MIPRLNISGDISFLMDTGADVTCLMPGEATRLAVPYGLLNVAPNPTYGVGGVAAGFVETCYIAFADADNLYVYQRELHIAPLDPATMSLPALLGRNILDNWQITYRPRIALLSCEVEVADAVLPLSTMATYAPIAPNFRHP